MSNLYRQTKQLCKAIATKSATSTHSLTLNDSPLPQHGPHQSRPVNRPSHSPRWTNAISHNCAVFETVLHSFIILQVNKLKANLLKERERERETQLSAHFFFSALFFASFGLCPPEPFEPLPCLPPPSFERTFSLLLLGFAAASSSWDLLLA